MYLKQIITWTLPSFRKGLVAHKYSEPFIGKISKELINREIEYKNIVFKFISPNTGLFRANPQYRSFFSFKNSIRSYFPCLLGEIEPNRKGIAQITLRVPLSIILITSALFTVVAMSNMEGFFTITSFCLGILKSTIVMIIPGIFFIIGFLVEKDHLHDGLMKLKEYLDT